MTQIITIAALRAAGATQALAERWLDHVAAACGLYEINTLPRIAAFLAQVGHESGGFRYTSEIWGPTASQRRYEGRKDLGNTQPGDGSRFRGHGLIQTTGRYNHARVRDRLRQRLGPDVPDFEQQPELLASDEWAATSAADYWDDKGLNALADIVDFERITRRINGGLNGQADRMARFERVQQALAADPEPVPVIDLSTPAQPITSTEAPMTPFVAAVLPSLIDLVPKLGKIFSSGSETAERNIKAAEIVVSAAKEAIGARNEQELMETIKADPEAAASVRAAIEAQWFRLEEVGGGITAAREANAAYLQPNAPGFWLNPAFWVSAGFLLMPSMILVDMLFVHPAVYNDTLRIQIVTAILALLGVVGAYWLGTSFSSQRKSDPRVAGG
ncbi:glycoside hydrolase family 19 protein [Paracidovorax oryzae]|uniref:glycoside hydrolase family 19 protein n=1 Tax=Paracidovorax oryzae TaxID=862720 RepID=UPI0035D0B3BD